jgi:hypothetical protein
MKLQDDDWSKSFTFLYLSLRYGNSPQYSLALSHQLLFSVMSKFLCNLFVPDTLLATLSPACFHSIV